jgi:hypothetical protein
VKAKHSVIWQHHAPIAAGWFIIQEVGDVRHDFNRGRIAEIDR